MRSYVACKQRRAIINTLDRLTMNVARAWRGGLQSLFTEVQKRTGEEPSDRMIRAILLECGERICPGDYRVTQKKLFETYWQWPTT